MANLLKRAVQAVFPDLASARLERNWQAYFPERPDARSPTEIFSEIYQNNWWGGQPGELYSGNGSGPEASASFVQTVREYIESHGIRSVVDLGCGDFRIGSQLPRPGLTYTGVDVVPALVESHQRTFARAGVEFVAVDIVDDELPNGDLYLLRQVLQHLSNAQIARVLAKLRDKPHVIISEHHPAPRRLKRPNRDKPAGRGIRVPLRSGVYPDRPPFSFPCRVIATTPVPPLITPGEVITTYAKI
jgi:SAM-dependent methyltransferase